MAKELTVVRTVEAQDGSIDWNMCYWFDISADPVKDSLGTIIPTQSSAQLADELKVYLDPAIQIAPIDTGLAGFLIKTLRQTLGEAKIDFVARAEADYAITKVNWLAQQKDLYDESGLQRDV